MQPAHWRDTASASNADRACFPTLTPTLPLPDTVTPSPTPVPPTVTVTPIAGVLPDSKFCTDPQVTALLQTFKNAILTSDGPLFASLVSPVHGLKARYCKKIPQDTRDYVVVQFFTNQGVIGTTLDGDYTLPAGVAQTVQQLAEAYFVGKDPFDIEMHSARFFAGQKARVRLFFLEIGLWDIIGKACGQPLYRLWGAHSSKVRPYAATVHFGKSSRERAEDALRFYETAFRAIKLRLHQEKPADDLALVAAVKEAVGTKMDVMVDANQDTEGRQKCLPFFYFMMKSSNY